MFLGAGCSTYCVWREAPELDEIHEPAAPSNARLFATRDSRDFLITFDENCPWHRKPVRRAYFAWENEAETKALKPPRYVPLSRTNELQEIRVFPATAAAATNRPPYAIEKPASGTITVFSTRNSESFVLDLPSYPSSIGLAKRVLLTPWTVAADASCVGGMAAVAYYFGVNPFWPWSNDSSERQ